jgi:PRTRC genetic system protein C
MQARAMYREFSFRGLKLPDPDPKMSLEGYARKRDKYCHQFWQRIVGDRL